MKHFGHFILQVLDYHSSISMCFSPVRFLAPPAHGRVMFPALGNMLEGVIYRTIKDIKRNGSTIPIMGAIHIVQLFTHCHPSHPYILCILLHSWDSFQLHQLGQAYDILQVLTPKFPTDTH